MNFDYIGNGGKGTPIVESEIRVYTGQMESIIYKKRIFPNISMS